MRIEHADASDDPELRIVVPGWMLDETACSMIIVRDKPQIQLQALVQLRELVDQLVLPTGEGHGDSGSIEAKGDRHETQISTQASCQDAASEATDP